MERERGESFGSAASDKLVAGRELAARIYPSRSLALLPYHQQQKRETTTTSRLTVCVFNPRAGACWRRDAAAITRKKQRKIKYFPLFPTEMQSLNYKLRARIKNK